jgi:cell division protein FtsQ
LLAGIPLILAGVGTYALLQSSLLRIQEVRLEGTETLDEASLVDLSGLLNASLIAPPFDDARERLMQIPSVKSVSFERDWPSGIKMRVEERVPWAFWSVAGKDYVVDSEGVVLAAGAPDGPAPRVIEMVANRSLGPGDRVDITALTLAERIVRESPRFLGQSVRELEYRPGVGVVAVFDGGLRVTFGDERSYEYKVAVLSELLDDLNATGVKPRSVDLRFGERVTYE